MDMKAVLLACMAAAAGALNPADSDEINTVVAQPAGAGAAWESFAFIEQSGEYVDKLRAGLKKINLPDGFRIELYAVAPDAGHMVISPRGIVTFVGTRKEDVWAITDRDKNRVADEVKRFAPLVDFDAPSGVCFSRDGFLYVIEQNRVLLFPAAEWTYENPDAYVVELVKQGELIPDLKPSSDHTTRICDVGPDDKLYISFGSTFSLEEADEHNETSTGRVIRMNRDGAERELITGDPQMAAGTVPTHVESVVHPADPAVLFYTGDQFPQKYRAGAFVIEQGSSKAAEPVGARVMFVPTTESGVPGDAEGFAEGWFVDSGEYPVDLAQLPDGSMLVSDELAGAIYRISYGGSR
jgi:glucose/arabinose dehydrogenase